MTGAEIIALVSVVAAAITSLGVPWLSARNAHRLAAQETRRSREDELRSAVLEDAAVALTEIIRKLDELRGQMSILTSEALGPLRDGLDMLWEYEDRMAVRLGRDAPEVSAYRDAITHLATAHGALYEGLADGFDGDVYRAIIAARNGAFDAQGRFFDATSHRVGPEEPQRVRFSLSRADRSNKASVLPPRE